MPANNVPFLILWQNIAAPEYRGYTDRVVNGRINAQRIADDLTAKSENLRYWPEPLVDEPKAEE